MLALKQIGKNKLIVYSFLIFATLLGTGFFIYKSLNMNAGSSDSVDTTVVDELALQKAQSLAAKGEAPETSLTPDNLTNEKNIQDEIDTSLFKNPKFIELRENPGQLPEFNIGKKNPFEP